MRRALAWRLLWASTEFWILPVQFCLPLRYYQIQVDLIHSNRKEKPAVRALMPDLFENKK